MAEVCDAWIVVVNWNGAALLPSCLSSLVAQTRPAHVLVVDNGSDDGSADAVGGFPTVEWLPAGRNLGFAAANNVGLRRALAAGARYVAIVNTDVRLEPDWLDRMIAAADAHPDAGIFGGLLVLDGDRSRVNSTGLVLDALGRCADRDFGLPLERLDRRDGPVLGVSGGAALFRSEALRRIGLFDPAYFAYYEDVDLSFRAARLGVRAWYVSSARAVHGFGKSFGPGSPRQKYLLARNHMRFAALHLPLPKALTVLPALALLRATVKAPLELVRGRPDLASAHLRASAAGTVAAGVALAQRIRRNGGIPRGAEPVGPG